MLMHDPLLTATLAGVLLGILLGGLLRYRQMSVQSIDLIGVPWGAATPHLLPL